MYGKRDLFILLKDSDEEIDFIAAAEAINDIISLVETPDNFIATHELVKRFRIVRKSRWILWAAMRELGRFESFITLN